MAGTVLITGASAGIGYAAAEAFLGRGYRVYAGARRLEKMAPLAARGARAFRLDMEDEASIEAAAGLLAAEADGPDVLVNNAGFGAHGAVEDVPLAEARRQFEVNLFGLARLTQLVLPGMRRRGGGRIINISSIAGKLGMPTGGWYHASKHALEALSDALRLEVKPFGIGVVLIEPGPIRTEWDSTALVNLRKYSGSGPYAGLVDRITGGLRDGYRAGAPGPEDVARVIVKAAEARRPSARYAVPFKAALMLFARRFLPDFAYDSILGLMLRRRG